MIRPMLSLVITFVPVLMVMGLMTPVVGPAIDHHYADRSPAHAHVLIGDDTNAHEHEIISSEHDHSLGMNGDGISLATSSVSSAYSSMTLDGATLESSIPSFDHLLIAVHIGESPRPDANAIAPLDRPPRIS